MDMRTHKTLAATATTDIRGTSATKYALEPTQWLPSIIDAAQKARYFETAVKVMDVPYGTKDLVAPYRKYYLGSMTDVTAENSEVTMTTVNNVDGVTFTPSTHQYAVGVSYDALRTNAVNMVEYARQELTNYLANTVDTAINAALYGATETTSSVSGAQTLFGGNATSTATLAASDVMSVDLVAEAMERLEDDTAYYWSTGTFTASTGTKNAWTQTEQEPFLLYIAPPQVKQLRQDSQFVNASEYGSDKVVKTGEIGEYLGVKVLATPQVYKATTWGSGALVGHTCMLVKSGACGGLAWGERPMIDAYDWKPYAQKRIQLRSAWEAKAIHKDAIVKIQVLDA